MQRSRMDILQMIEDGAISATEALRLLDSLPDPVAAVSAATEKSAPDPAIQKWKQWWRIPFGIGLGITLIGAILMYAAFNAWGVGFGIFFASIPFFLGVLVMALAGWSKSARWLHVRVDTGKDEFPRHISISFPISIKLVAWIMRMVPQRNVNASNKLRTASEIIAAMEDGVTAEAPLFVEVNNEGREKVQVFIG